jgi:hypothetical protein
VPPASNGRSVSLLRPQAAQAISQLSAAQRAATAAAATRAAELDTLTVAAAAARDAYARVRDVLAVLVAAQEPLTRAQLAALHLEAALPQLPAWGVLFSLEAGEGGGERADAGGQARPSSHSGGLPLAPSRLMSTLGRASQAQRFQVGAGAAAGWLSGR